MAYMYTCTHVADVRCILHAVLGLHSELTGSVESLYGVDAHSKIVMKLLCLNLPVQLPTVLGVGRRVGRGISDHDQGALGAGGPRELLTDLV